MDHNKFITLENNRAKRTIPIIEYEEKMGKYSEEWANSINIKVGENCVSARLFCHPEGIVFCHFTSISTSFTLPTKRLYYDLHSKFRTE